MKSNLLFALLLTLLISSCSQQRFIHQGSIERYQRVFDSSAERIWFKDSAVIIEYRSISEDLEGRVTQPVYKYVYLDLKTGIGQEYYNFRDTAKPLCGFTFSPRFITALPINPNHIVAEGEYFNMPDTVENGVVWKRIRVPEKDTTHQKSNIYFLKKSRYNSIFSINPFFEKKPYKIMKWRLVSPYTTTFLEGGYEYAETALDKKIIAIFSAWDKNGKDLNYPLKPADGKITPCPVIYSHDPNAHPLDHTTL